MDTVLNLKKENSSDEERLNSAEKRKAILAQVESMESDEEARQRALVKRARERSEKRVLVTNESAELQQMETQKRPEAKKNQTQTEGNPRKEISFGTGFLMVGTALLFDTLQALSALIVFDLGMIGMLITFFAFMTFWFWFRIKGIHFNRPSRVLTFGGATAIEMFPFLNALPTWTLAVVIIIGTTNTEKYAKFVPLAEKAVETYKKVQGNK